MSKELQLKFIEDNYPLYTNHISTRRIRHRFFREIQTEILAYLLGFYAADGNINEKRKTLRIHLLKRDNELVYLYKDIIAPDARTFTVKEHLTTGRNGMLITAHESFGIDIVSAELCNDLVNLGYGYRKSYLHLSMLSIPEELKIHFIRGYFDGDGSFSTSFVQEKGKSDRVRGRFDIGAKYDTLLIEIMLFFDTHNIKINLNYTKRDDMYKLTTTSRAELSKIFHLLYDNSNFYLSRKFYKFNHYVNTEVTQLIIEHRNALEVNVKESNNPPKSAEQEWLENNYFDYS